MKILNHIFIYGTLKKDCINHSLLENKAQFISRAMTDKKYAMYPNTLNTFPFLLKSEEKDYIFGELYKITSSDLLEQLDELENIPIMYIRENIDIVIIEDNNEIILKAMVYFKNEDNYKEFINMSKSITWWNEK